MRGLLECCKIRFLVCSAITRFPYINNRPTELRLNSCSSRSFFEFDNSPFFHSVGRMNFSTHSEFESDLGATCQVTLEEDLKPATNALVELIESKKASHLVIEVTSSCPHVLICLCLIVFCYQRKAQVFCEAYRSLKNENKIPILNQFADIWSGRQDVTLQFAKKYISAHVLHICIITLFL